MRPRARAGWTMTERLHELRRGVVCAPLERDDGDGEYTIDAPDPRPGPEAAMLRRAVARQVVKLLAGLPPRERRVLELMFGLTDDGEWSADQVGAAFGISRARVYQIAKAGMEKLRRAAGRPATRRLCRRDERAFPGRGPMC